MRVIKVAAVQATPVYMDLAGTITKACELIAEAAKNGAKLIAFPEAFVPGYPYWAWLDIPLNSYAHFEQLYRNSISIPGQETEKLCQAASEAGAVVVIGVNEIDPTLTGTIYNTNLIIDNTGKILGKHRKLVPTHAERLVWGNGDGSSYMVHETVCGRIGTLLCGENTNTLARFALLAQGEEIHIANFPAFPFSQWYQETEAIKIRCKAHAFEGKVFVIAATSALDEQLIGAIKPPAPEKLKGTNFALSGTFGPDGLPLGEHLIDTPGIAFAEIDLDTRISAKLMHDITGHYNQFHVLSLNINRQPATPLRSRP